MDKTNDIIAWEILFILVFGSLLLVNSVENGFSGITGKAVAVPTQDAILTELDAAVHKLDFVNDIGDLSVCLVVNIDSNTKYSYEILKVGEAITVSSSSNLYCRGQDVEDIIVSYVSYDKLKEHMDNVPGFAELRKANTVNYYLLPSKQILAGSMLANPSDFNAKFRNLLDKYFTAAEIDALLNPQGPQERQAISYISYAFYFIIGMVVLIVVISVLIAKLSKKPTVEENLELTAYIKSSRSQGYDEEQIKKTLLENGWPEADVQQAMKLASAEVEEPAA